MKHYDIDIHRGTYDCELNLFFGRSGVNRDEVVVKTKTVYGKVYTYVEPAAPGHYAFGGTILYTSNAIYPEFTKPLKLHDRQMDLEKGGYYD